MPPKTDTEIQTKPDKKIGGFSCTYKSPGPKYKLKTLVGYKEHCLSRHRNPAYTFGIRHHVFEECLSPGPKYILDRPKRNGFTFGLVGKTFVPFCGPGPKYLLPSPKGPSFTIKSRTKTRQTCVTPGPISVNLPRAGPAFYIGQRLPVLKRDCVPGPKIYNDILVKQRAPMYSMSYRHPIKEICRSPGPKYNLKFGKTTPIYSFGMKHSECAPPYFIECDDQC
ncbi:outer dense fiber protein 3-B-like [Apis laboriosa]|uniref:outer dense fiber protein 3-B-like n=1 Tax=Apis laboriosa TaxID=183418 RepID=UPI0003DF56F9|nr:outer dense fiber protein 3-B-like [Apis laboriosa]